MSRLKNLNDGFCVLNDVEIKLTSWIQYKGNNRNSAQVDHMVIGPTGVFVIETKNWSDQYAESAERNPLEQADSASFLTHVFLNRELGYKTRIQAVVVPLKGNIAYNRKDFPYVNVCSPEELTDYILGRTQKHSKKEVDEIVDALFECVDSP